MYRGKYTLVLGWPLASFTGRRDHFPSSLKSLFGRKCEIFVMVIRLRTKPRLEIEAEVNSKMAHRWYSLDVIATMSVQKKKQKRNKSWGFDFVIMHNLLSFCASTWPSYHVIDSIHLALHTGGWRPRFCTRTDFTSPWISMEIHYGRRDVT